MTFRIATWNLDHASNKSRAVRKQLDQIHSVDADIWVLTETCDKVDLSEGGYKGATPKYRNKYNTFWTAIWARPPITIVDQIGSCDDETVTCAELSTPEGRMLVYATILTWKMDGVREGTSKPWVEHHKAIHTQGNDWSRLQGDHPGRPLIMAGDFNQTRDGSGRYCSSDSVEMLSSQLERNYLAWVTEEDFGKAGKLVIDPKKGYYRHNVDHICVTPPLQAVNIEVWDHFSGEHYLSDHNGVFADVAWHS